MVLAGAKIEIFLKAKKPKRQLDASHFTAPSSLSSPSGWKSQAKEVGVLKYIADDVIERLHKPHDCRHTFTSMWKTQKLDEAMRRKIQGHSGQGIGERVYTEYEMTTLLEEINQLWTP